MKSPKPILAPLLLPTASLALGIAGGREPEGPPPLLVGGLLLAFLLLAFFLSRWHKLQSLLLCLCCTMLGYLLSAHYKMQLHADWPPQRGYWHVVVSSNPSPRGKTVSMDALLSRTGRKIQLRLMNDKRSCQLAPGDCLEIYSTVKPLSAHAGYRTYLECQGYAGEAFVWYDDWQHASFEAGGISLTDRVRIFFLQQRGRLLRLVRARVGEDEAYSLLAAMALGDKQAVSREQKEQFSTAGTSHLLALSGLHLGIIYMLLARLLPRRRLKGLSQLLLLAAVWAFVLLAGMPLSVVRSATMISLYALALLLNRGRAPLNTLVLTAGLMLLARPYSLFDVGFQLSFSSVAAILLFVPLFPQSVPRLPHSSFLVTMTTVSIAAQIGTAPLVAYHFGRFSPWFLLANYVSIPLAMLILYTMFFSLLCCWWPQALSLLISVPATLASWLSAWTRWVAALPSASIGGLKPTVLHVLLLYLIILSSWAILRYFAIHRVAK